MTSANVTSQVLALHVALEPEARGIEELARALDPRVALALLLADRQERHARPGDTEDPLGEDRAHLRVLDEVLRGRIGIGPDVEQDHRPARGDHLDGQRGAVDAGQAPEPQDRGGHPGPGVTGAHDGVGISALDHVDGHEDGRILLLAKRQRRMLVHPDDLAGMDDRDVGGKLARDPANDRLVTDEEELVLRVRPRMIEGAGHDLRGTVIAAHRVDRDADPGARRRGWTGMRLRHRVSGRRRRRPA